MLLIGFAGAFRRSELVALDVNDVEETAEGIRARIRRGKTDQEGAGATVAIVRGSVACPVEALKAWLNAAGITSGAIFRRVNKSDKVSPDRLTAQSVALIVKSRAQQAGLDPQSFAGHSLRSGSLTSAARRGASIFKMMESRVTALSILCSTMSETLTCSGIMPAPACSNPEPHHGVCN